MRLPKGRPQGAPLAARPAILAVCHALAVCFLSGPVENHVKINHCRRRARVASLCTSSYSVAAFDAEACRYVCPSIEEQFGVTVLASLPGERRRGSLSRCGVWQVCQIIIIFIDNYVVNHYYNTCN